LKLIVFRSTWDVLGTLFMKIHPFLSFSLFVTVSCAAANDNPIEIGSIRWGRDLDSSLQVSEQTGRPVLVLFQEVPGCSGCQAFGSTVLTNPLIVEAVEDEFVPVLVYNNRGGSDKALLNRFNEPAWNYQVIRYLDASGVDIIPRQDRVWSIEDNAARMVAALQKRHRRVPQYLEMLALENDTDNLAESAFAVPCFWVGEVKLGSIHGVITTEAGWIDSHEVTQVVYNRQVITLEELVEQARGLLPLLKVYVPNHDAHAFEGVATGTLDARYKRAAASDQKKQLEGWRAIDEVPGLTAMQLTKINAFLPSGRSRALAWLSPRQRQALRGTEHAGAPNTDQPHAAS